MRKLRWVFLLTLLAVPYGRTVAQSPTLGAGAIVNGASFAAAGDPNGALSAGAIVSAFGTNLATSTQGALTVPLSTTINGTSLTFTAGGVDYPAPLFFASSGQVNAQVPFNVPLTGVTAQITVNGKATASNPVSMTSASPGIFVTDPNLKAGALLHNDTFALVTSSSPAKRGEFIDIFCTGLGAVDKNVASGTVGPNPAANTTITPLVNVGGQPASVVFSGLAPGFVGLYQVAFQVPNVPGGNQNVEIVSNSIHSNTVVMVVAQ